MSNPKIFETIVNSSGIVTADVTKSISQKTKFNQLTSATIAKLENQTGVKITDDESLNKAEKVLLTKIKSQTALLQTVTSETTSSGSIIKNINASLDLSSSIFPSLKDIDTSAVTQSEEFKDLEAMYTSAKKICSNVDMSAVTGSLLALKGAFETLISKLLAYGNFDLLGSLLDCEIADSDTLDHVLGYVGTLVKKGDVNTVSVILNKTGSYKIGNVEQMITSLANNMDATEANLSSLKTLATNVGVDLSTLVSDTTSFTTHTATDLTKLAKVNNTAILETETYSSDDIKFQKQVTQILV